MIILFIIWKALLFCLIKLYLGIITVVSVRCDHVTRCSVAPAPTVQLLSCHGPHTNIFDQTIGFHIVPIQSSTILSWNSKLHFKNQNCWNKFEGMGDSDSENEGSQTNISRLVIRPPGEFNLLTLNILEILYMTLLQGTPARLKKVTWLLRPHLSQPTLAGLTLCQIQNMMFTSGQILATQDTGNNQLLKEVKNI